VRTIRASSAETRETTAVVQSATAAYDAGLRSARFAALISPASSLAVQGSFLLVLALGGASAAAAVATAAPRTAGKSPSRAGKTPARGLSHTYARDTSRSTGTASVVTPASRA
jgi:TctA family transporter